MRQNNLATYVGIEGPSLVRLLDQLEAGDFVIRKADKVDRRAKTLWLTKKGEQTAAMLENILVGLRGEILADVSEEDLTAALRVLSAFDRAGHTMIPSVGEIETTP
ncbi:DNA-binding MarR family transcriptional regulator [Phyllobacterium myrsinacearum]|uniref:DNA-binding MarR family transcriptional regulator n=1 Tax=Phyllobacterium myrsinacearum TaxID=28101 RepID=A0A839EJV8_9HYPH|nr:DNA-binding MarR family transcriptional regulator [Phyllobacterium myrsinacearum]